MKHIFVTGTAGFIGFWLAQKLIEKGYTVTGFDSINDYYDVNLKHARLRFAGIDTNELVYGKQIVSTTQPAYSFIQGDLTDSKLIEAVFRKQPFDAVVNLAAQAGVRYSLTHPHVYTQSNVTGFLNILEVCRHHEIKHLLYASSSSVYGLNSKMPLDEHQRTDHPMSLYAATKKANELMAHSYSHLYGLPTTGLRFFTVYGPWGRPDMALFIFAKAILENQPIRLFNNGEMVRDFTFVHDVTESVSRLVPVPPAANANWNSIETDTASSSAPFRVLNIGNNNPVQLNQYIEALEQELGKKAIREYLPMQPGDVPFTNANCNDLETITGFRPRVRIDEGVKVFVDWFKAYYGVGR
jgi:UDP-glucuronate 4-epimerase